MADPFDSLRLPIVPIEPRPDFAAALLRRIEGREVVARQPATVRYFVDDVAAAVSFYTRMLGFDVELHPSPEFAMLYRGELRLLLSLPGEPHVLPGGAMPEPGGWNRISLRVTDLAGTVARLRSQGAVLRSGIVAGVAVDTVVLEDPAGNLVELFEPRTGYHDRQ
jgi:catechol 2,3-dioxygenase-like lactoylglutathione lyase family enzyme